VTSRHGWERLARLLIDRRGELNPAYKSRRKFAAETGLNDRLIADLENARRADYKAATLRAVEVAYRWAPGSIARVVGDNGEPTPIYAEPVGEQRPADAAHGGGGVAVRQRAPWLLAELQRHAVDIEVLTHSLETLRDIGERFGYSIGDLLVESGTVAPEELRASIAPTAAPHPPAEPIDVEIARIEADPELPPDVKRDLVASARKLREAKRLAQEKF
jgi:hypothetical protein